MIPFLLLLTSLVAPPEDPPGWRERGPHAPSQQWDALEGKPAPALDGLVSWSQSDALTWEDLRGNVVLVVFWRSLQPGMVEELARLADLAERHGEAGLVVLAVHDHEAPGVRDRFLQRYRMPFALAVDPSNVWRNAFVRDRRPTHHLVGRDGRVRIAGVGKRRDGEGVRYLERAVAAVLAEPYEGQRKRVALRVADGAPLVPRENVPKTQEDAQPRPGPGDPSETVDPKPQLGEDGWPVKVRKPLYAGRDLRGRPAPPLAVEHWVTPEPDLEGKCMLVCLFSTTSAHSKLYMPVLERLRNKFEDDGFAVIALSEQSYDRNQRPGRPWADAVPRYFETFPDYRFHVALDGLARVQRAVDAEALPHVLLVGSDGIVRWQGYPWEKADPLTPKLVRAVLKRDAKRRAEEEAKRPEDDGGGGG